MLKPLSMSQCCSMDYMKGYNAAIEKANARIAELEAALVWCGGSSDFCPGGIAREGWMKVCAPLLQQLKP